MSGLLRLMLFLLAIASLLLSLGALENLNKQSRNGVIDQIPRSQNQFKFYFICVTTFVASVVGIFGSFYHHAASLKFVSQPKTT